ncbi:OprD family outer membrane porin [Arcicella aquatica]|uniref:OprD family outer membrane porin n=1 Tax=Arcicella aquatica TaxID=217141 RepID=A0ABU5QR10_9BACT|nr:OprD family outer membrane porin [Arcicella aquatica]MEA5259523.1 OprD family outer membrane porin [Arcicella aquatica]
MKRKITIIILLLLWANINYSQDINDRNGIVKDTNNLAEAFLKGTFYGQFRLLSIVTNNQNELSDYHATAVGLGFGYQSAYYKGFQINIGCFLTQDIVSSDFTVQDPTTKANNRYEVGMYDLADVNRKNLLFRLQMFYLKYRFKNSSVLVGNYTPQNLFINAQDGRMSPTMVQGVVLTLNPNKKIQIKLDLILGVSPRSTTHWYSVENSLGYYPSGVNLNGTKSQYFGNISSAGIGILDVNYMPIPRLKILMGNILAENIFNTAYIKAEYTHNLNNTQKFLIGAMFITQNSDGNGGNSDILKTYYPTHNKSNIINARIRYTTKMVESSINFGRITADGRYLMPREWGVEQFYTFLPRERIEGSGDVWAYSAKIAKNWFNKSLKTELGYGYYRLPDVKNTNLNKYGIPSFSQFTASINYQFRGFLKGTNAQFLYVQKNNQGEIYDNERYIINKVNMSQLNFILNYQF